VALTARPMADTAFTDRGPGLAPGRPLAYTVASLVKRGGKVTEGPQVTLQATPVTLPPGWTGSSINEGSLSGSAVFHRATRAITLRGSGARAGGPADEGYFLNQPVTGDFRITVRMLTTPTMTHLVARAGLMIRESLAAGARMAHLSAIPVHASWLEWRPTANGNLSGRLVIASDQFKLPLTLRLIRQGDALRVESSLDEGKSFQPAGDPLRFTPSLPPTLYVGLEICSLDANQRSEATFRDLTIEKLSGDERR
jgi:regulation of enolase protein 1 (concanavalin A-like superfamily)